MITSQTKTFGIVAGSICILALALLGAMLYLIDGKDAAYEEQLIMRATRIATEKEVESLRSRMVTTANDREELARYVLTEDTVGDFLSRIESLAHTERLTAETRSLAVEAIEGNAVFEYLTLEVTATGSFAAVTEMLSLVESLPYQVHVRTAAVERISEAQGDGLWRGAYRLYVTKYK